MVASEPLAAMEPVAVVAEPVVVALESVEPVVVVAAAEPLAVMGPVTAAAVENHQPGPLEP